MALQGGHITHNAQWKGTRYITYRNEESDQSNISFGFNLSVSFHCVSWFLMSHWLSEKRVS